jgi:hypothetical protein
LSTASSRRRKASVSSIVVISFVEVVASGDLLSEGGYRLAGAFRGVRRYLGSARAAFAHGRGCARLAQSPKPRPFSVDFKLRAFADRPALRSICARRFGGTRTIRAVVSSPFAVMILGS